MRDAGKDALSFAILYPADPWQRADGGTVRVQALYRALAQFGATIVFPSGPAALLDPDSRVKSLKQHYLALPIRRAGVLRQLRAELLRIKPRAVISASHALTPAAFGVTKNLWIDHFDLWSDFGRREAHSRHGVARLTNLAQATLWGRREQRESRLCRIATVASSSDASKIPHAVWMPTPVPLAQERLRRPEGRVAGFLANFEYWPNRDAYDNLVASWAPRLRAQGWRVVVAGYAAGSLPTAAGIDNVGTVQDVADFYDNVDVCLAPLRLGGGMKVKVIESLAHGRPVLGTPHSVDGLAPSVAERVLVSDVPPDDLSRAFGALDYSEPLAHVLGPYSTEAFEHTAQELARSLLAETP